MSRPVQIDPAAVQNKLREVQNNSTSGNEEMALWVIVNLIFSTGLQQKEITDLKDGDVISNNNIVNQITLNRQRSTSRPTSYGSRLRRIQPRQKPVQLPLPSSIQTLLNGYVQCLHSGMVSTATGSLPLFPTYSGEKGRKNLEKHLERYQTEFRELRRAGVIRFNTDCLRNDPDPDKRKVMDRAVAETARHFQTTERTVEDYIRGIHRPPGRRKVETRTEDHRAADLLYGLRSTEYEIFVENKVRELITEMEELFGDSVEAKTIYSEWLYDSVLDSYTRFLGIVAAKKTKPVAIQKMEPLERPMKSLWEEIRRFLFEQEKYDSETQRARREEFEQQLMIRNRPKYKDLDELKRMIFDLRDRGRRGLNKRKIKKLKLFQDEYKKRLGER